MISVYNANGAVHFVEVVYWPYYMHGHTLHKSLNIFRMCRVVEFGELAVSPICFENY